MIKSITIIDTTQYNQDELDLINAVLTPGEFIINMEQFINELDIVIERDSQEWLQNVLTSDMQKGVLDDN